MRIAHLGTFDVANYGDLLFPLLLERRIRELLAGHASADGDIDFVHFSPRGGEPVWSDARATLPVRELFVHGRFEAVVLGGGHLVHALPTRLAEYQSPPLLALTAYPELWLGAAQLAARDGARLIWNAPGLPRSLDGRAAELLSWATAQVDYLAVRDEASAEHLRRSGVETPTRIVPDTALDVRRLWTDDDLQAAYRSVFDEHHREPPSRTIAVHVNDRYLNESPAILAARLDGLCHVQQATAILLALGPCHGDDKLARRVADAMQSNPIVVDTPASLLQLTACLASCAMYLGSSLHGTIVATAFGRPVWCVAEASTGGRRKFSGFLRQVAVLDRLVGTWETACLRASAGSELGPRSMDSQGANAALEEHWRAIGRLLVAREPATSARLVLGREHLSTLDGLLAHSAPLTHIQTLILTAQAETASRAVGRLQRGELALESSERKIASHCAKLAEQKRRLRSEQVKARQAERKCRETQRRLERGQRDLHALNGWLNSLRQGVEALLATRRWRLGNRLGNALNRVLRRDPEPLVTEWLYDVFRRHARWRCARDDATNRTHSPLDHNRRPTVSIVVSVHNAIGSVRNCLESLLACTHARHEIILVDDASADECRRLLEDFASRRAKATLRRHDVRQGYTRAANSGWRMAAGDFVVLLNSDTIVTPNWLERIIACFERDASLGLVGPLSNAASWQSVPERFDPHGDWGVNALPQGWDANKMAAVIEHVTERRPPRVPLLNGFCLAIRSAVWNQIGYFDEIAFPDGYGEETDYCLRAAAAGFQLAVADDVYVFHAKSQSYGHKRRGELTERGQRTLRARHGDATLQMAVEQLRHEPTLAALRVRVANAIAADSAIPLAAPRRELPSVLFLLPVRGGGGGAHSVVQEAAGMRKLGTKAAVAIESRFAEEFRRQYPNWFADDLFFVYDDPAMLTQFAGEFDVAVATVYFSLRQLRQIVRALPNVLPAYYVQDYEPRFFSSFSRHRREALRSYGSLPGMVHFAKTDWIRNQVTRRHGVEMHSVAPSLDHGIFFPFQRRSPDGRMRIAAMIRPSTPYRGALRTLRVLRELQRRHGDIELHYFGTSDDECRELAFEGVSAEHWHGRLTREAVAELLRASDVFVDLSDYQAFGRTGLEAMACGAAVVLPVEGGVQEYAAHDENALLVDTNDETACLGAVERLLTDGNLRTRLVAAGLRTASRYSIEIAARSELELFQRCLQERRSCAPGGLPASAETTSVPALADKPPVARRTRSEPSTRLRVHAFLPPVGGGWPGSSYIRLLLPLRHPTLSEEVALTYSDSRAAVPGDVDIVIVQRTAIADRSLARTVVQDCRARGRRLIVELDDDLWALPSQHPERRRYRKLLPALEYVIECADAVSVPTERLAGQVASRTARVLVIPNALDEHLWFSPVATRRGEPSETGRPMRILLMGTRTHAADVELIAPAARRLVREFGDEVRFEAVGCVPRGTSNDWYRQLKVSVHTREYPAFVRHLRRRARWQIAVAPLRANEFNAAKSPLKFLDYGALGLAGVYSDLPPYTGAVRQLETGLITGDDPDSWFDALRTLVLDVAFRQRVADAAKDDVQQNHGLTTVTPLWRAVLTGDFASNKRTAKTLPLARGF